MIELVQQAQQSVVETLKCSLGSVKVNENGSGTIRKLWNDFLFAFYSNYGCIFSRFNTIHERDRHPAIDTAQQQESRYMQPRWAAVVIPRQKLVHIAKLMATIKEAPFYGQQCIVLVLIYSIVCGAF